VEDGKVIVRPEFSEAPIGTPLFEWSLAQGPLFDRLCV
jgi:hypothetical protein